MKYLRHYLIHAGLCLLLVCSANVTSAQVIASLEKGSITDTPTTRTITFNINLSEQLKVNEAAFVQIRLDNVLEGEIASASAESYMVTGCVRFSFSFPRYNLCMDDGEKNVTLQLILNNSFDRRKTITVSLETFSPFGNRPIAEGVRRDPINSVLRYPGTAIFIRSKVFLEGPLQ